MISNFLFFFFTNDFVKSLIVEGVKYLLSSKKTSIDEKTADTIIDGVISSVGNSYKKAIKAD